MVILISATPHLEKEQLCFFSSKTARRPAVSKTSCQPLVFQFLFLLLSTVGCQKKVRFVQLLVGKRQCDQVLPSWDAFQIDLDSILPMVWSGDLKEQNKNISYLMRRKTASFPMCVFSDMSDIPRLWVILLAHKKRAGHKIKMHKAVDLHMYGTWFLYFQFGLATPKCWSSTCCCASASDACQTFRGFLAPTTSKSCAMM